VERLRDIFEAIGNIERHARRGRQDFENDELLQTCALADTVFSPVCAADSAAHRH
jgi:hypothetical protein